MKDPKEEKVQKEQVKLTEVMHERVRFLVAQMPKMEVVVDRLLAKLKDSGDPELDKKVDLAMLFRMYTQIFTFYNQSLDLIRKILVYFPVETIAQDRDLVQRIQSLNPVEKAKLMAMVKKLEEARESDLSAETFS